MSWKHAKAAVRERIATNQRRYREAPTRDALEADAIREAAQQQPVIKTLPEVLSSSHFLSVIFSVGEPKRYLLHDNAARYLRDFDLPFRKGFECYCRACGRDIAADEWRRVFLFRWAESDPADTSTLFPNFHNSASTVFPIKVGKKRTSRGWGTMKAKRLQNCQSYASE